MPARVSFKKYRTAAHTRRQGRQSQFEQDVFEGLPIRRWDRQWTWVSQSNASSRLQPQLPLPKDTHLLTPLAQSLLQAARNGSLAQRHHQPAQADDEEDDFLSVSSPGSLAGSIAHSRDGTSPDPNSPSATKRLFQTNRWSCIQGEPAEPTYLSRMPDHQIRRTRKIQHRTNGTKVVFVDDAEEAESSPPQGAVAAGEVKGSEPPSAVQTPAKKRAPPPRRKVGRGRKPGQKKGQPSISSMPGGPHTPSAREGSVLHTDGDMEMLDADDSLIHTPTSRVDSDSPSSSLNSPDVRASVGPPLPDVPALNTQSIPAEPPRSVPELPVLDVEMTNSFDTAPHHPSAATALTEPEAHQHSHSHPHPHPLSRQITPPPQSAVEPTVKIEIPPVVEMPSISEPPAPIEPKEPEPAAIELAKQDIMQQEAAERDLALDVPPVELKQEEVVQKPASPPAPSPARTLSPAPAPPPAAAPVAAAVVSPVAAPASPPATAIASIISPVAAPVASPVPSPIAAPLSPPRAPSPPKETAAPTSLPTLKATPELAPVPAPVLSPSPMPILAVETAPSPIPAPEPAPTAAPSVSVVAEAFEAAPTLPPVSIASPPSTTQAHAQRASSPKPVLKEEPQPVADGVSHSKPGSSIAALLNGNTPSPAPVAAAAPSAVVEKPVSPAALSPLVKSAVSPPPADDSVKIPDVTSPPPAAATAGPSLAEGVEVSEKEAAASMVRTPPETSS